MSLCESPNATTLRAGPPLRIFRSTNSYTHCLVDKLLDQTSLTEETNTYDELPLEIKELPDRKDYNPNDFEQLEKGIFVIPYDRPDTIVIAKETPWYDKKTLRCRTQKNGSTLPLKERRIALNRIYHTYLTDGAPVLAAGEFRYDRKGDTMRISNESGHYAPSSKTLEYAKCLFEKKGYKVETTSHSRTGVNEFNRNSKTLSEWASKSYKNWYREMAKGGKRKIRKQKTRKSMRGK